MSKNSESQDASYLRDALTLSEGGYISGDVPAVVVIQRAIVECERMIAAGRGALDGQKCVEYLPSRMVGDVG